MEASIIRGNLRDRIQNKLACSVIRDRRFLDDEQLLRSEQLAVLEEIFNANVRDAEISEISDHFAPILRNDHPYHLALWGKTGTGKTLTVRFFLNLLAEMCSEQAIPMREVHLDLSTPRPCFRALNDLACLLNASKRYKKGISLEELMLRIEESLADYKGYLVLFVDEVDNIRRDKDTFMSFLVRRLPQAVPSKLILVFASNRLTWPDNLDPRVKSFLRLNELIFKPYDAVDLQKILDIRVRKAINPEAVKPGVIEKIAALASRDHGDARQAVTLLARSACLAEKTGQSITLDLVDRAASEIEQDKYVTMIRTAPVQLQLAMAAVIQAARAHRGSALNSNASYDAYQHLAAMAKIRALTRRAFGDLLNELDMYCFLRAHVFSRGRYGRNREISLDLPAETLKAIESAILLNLGLGRSTQRTLSF
ncbi:MAG: AAA family ATPase [Phycisphaerae bacterium]|nr:AAA family ATPase [Phycisphaerae bacterium]